MELLEEQQEPFLLAVYLLENGCGAERIPTSEASSTSWTAVACRTLQKLTNHGLCKRKKDIHCRSNLGPPSFISTVSSFLTSSSVWRTPRKRKLQFLYMLFPKISFSLWRAIFSEKKTRRSSSFRAQQHQKSQSVAQLAVDKSTRK